MHIKDLKVGVELDSAALAAIRGGSGRPTGKRQHSPFYLIGTGGTANGPRPPEDQIILPDNPVDILDVIDALPSPS